MNRAATVSKPQIHTLPAFQAPASGNYRLQGTSPVRDVGNDNSISSFADIYDLDRDGDTSEMPPDLDLNDRVVNNVVDLGAYEQQTLPDADGDGVKDSVDNCPNTANANQADGNSNGVGDACEGCPNDPDDDLDGDGVCGDFVDGEAGQPRHLAHVGGEDGGGLPLPDDVQVFGHGRLPS